MRRDEHFEDCTIYFMRLINNELNEIHMEMTVRSIRQTLAFVTPKTQFLSIMFIFL